jgi:hypothetical protein
MDMHINTVVRSATLGVIVASLAACGPSEEARRKADSASVAAAQAKAVTQAGEVIGARREAQAHFDSARAAFRAKRTAIASKELNAAAVFTRDNADSATGAARNALVSSAAELERLATQVSKSRVKSVKTLDYAFARTQLAEAQFHQARAVAAFQGTKIAASGAELLMGVDHFERSFVDAGRTAKEPAKKAIADARSIASKLISGTSVAPADVESALTALGIEIESFSMTAAKLKG